MRAGALLALALLPALALGQELEPRAYSNAPVGTTFLLAGYTRITGPVLLDPSSIATDVNATINGYSLGFARFFELFGRSANFSVGLPYIDAELTGKVQDSPTSVHRSGF